MSAKQLPQDELAWILKLNATQAEQELHKYTKELKKSEDEHKRLREELEKNKYEFGTSSVAAKKLPKRQTLQIRQLALQ